MSKLLSLDAAKSNITADQTLFETILKPYIAKLREVAGASDYEQPESSLKLISDEAQISAAVELAKQYQDVELIIVVGIGGSNLGTMAVQEALFGRQYNLAGKPRILYADTVDTLAMKQIVAQLEEVVGRKGRVLVNMISKSGTTTETVANGQVLFDVLTRHDVALPDAVVMTTDEGSKLWQIAEELGVSKLALPKPVGGRYSVFSAVGLFPLAVLGIDITALIVGAREVIEPCLSDDLEQNLAARSALTLFTHYQQGRTIHDTFCFASQLEGFGKWYRQLTAESLGKVESLHGQEIHAGITPTVSIGSTDLHSMVQLYLSGPDHRVTTFVRVRELPVLALPQESVLAPLVSHLQTKHLSAIMDAIIEGVIFAYQEAKRPSLTLSLPNLDARSIGQFLQFKMVEIMLLGQLLRVNAFDQPAVESYKSEMRRVLENA
jgi:glucose-6-phosphate isomerase